MPKIYAKIVSLFIFRVDYIMIVTMKKGRRGGFRWSQRSRPLIYKYIITAIEQKK